MPNTTRRRMKRNGQYLSLRDVRCECGHPATRQVQVAQFNANDTEIINVLPLCEDCYELMRQDEPGVLLAA